MATLNLHIVKKEVAREQFVTRTCIGKKKGVSKIVFHNDSNDVLTIAFDPGNVIRNSKGKLTGKISVLAKDNAAVNFDAGAAKGTEVKYTATIGRAAPEDPIIIID